MRIQLVSRQDCRFPCLPTKAYGQQLWAKPNATVHRLRRLALLLVALNYSLLHFAGSTWASGQEAADSGPVSTAIADQQSTATDPTQPSVKPRPKYQIIGQALNGKSYGVGRLSVQGISVTDDTWAIDQAIRITSKHCSIWFPVRLAADSTRGGRPATIELYFIFHDGYPHVVDLAVNGELVAQDIPIAEGLGGISLANGIDRWWNAFCEQSAELAPRELYPHNRDLLASLGQLLGLSTEGLSPEPSRLQKDASVSQLEREFERTLGMLLGFESVRLAMMTDQTPPQLDITPARLQLPKSLDIAAQRLPANTELDRVRTHAIAGLVPPDCYFVRCKSLANYCWLRGLMLDWGGSFSELISNSVLRSDVRARLEKQLVLSAESLREAGADALLEDLAIIGSDLLFEQGAGIGILLQAKPGRSPELADMIRQQREKLGLRSQSKQFSGVPASLLLTPDNRVRSYHLRMGDFVLITNSQHLADSVVRAQQSGKSLANLDEFRFAMATNPKSADSKILFYLSDPFFQRLASAPFRIELGRRLAAEADCRRIEMAAVIATATGHPVSDNLPAFHAAVLPDGFGMRCDGSSVELRDGQAMDTLRGKLGTFIPVVDVDVESCNPSEQTLYRVFSSNYRSEWRMVDPVLATLDADPQGAHQERLNLSVHITPYARSEYTFLTQTLGAMTPAYLTAGKDQLMGVSANLEVQGQSYAALLGLQDSKLDFKIQKGQLLIEGSAKDNQFVNDRSYAVVTPPGTHGLLALNGLVQSLQQRKPIEIRSPAPVFMQLPSAGPQNPSSFIGSLFNPIEPLFRAGMTVIELAARSSATANITQDEQWTIYATDRAIHRQLPNQLAFDEARQPAEIHAFIQDVSQSAVAPYLEAYAFCQARRESAQLAAWLNLWTIGLATEPQEFLEKLDQTLGGEIVCPLGGQWEVTSQDSSGPGRWISSSWQEPALASVNAVPQDYHSAFLAWFRGLELGFSLTEASLESEVYIDYRPTSREKGAVDQGGVWKLNPAKEK